MRRQLDINSPIINAALRWFSAAGDNGHQIDALAMKLNRIFGVKTGRAIVAALEKEALIQYSADGSSATITAKGIESL
jgi:hypothetical protein